LAILVLWMSSTVGGRHQCCQPGWYTSGRLFCLFIGGSYGTYGCCNNNLYPAQ